MILNIYGQTDGDKNVWSLPNIILDRRLHYQVAVMRVYFVTERIINSSAQHDLLMIRSNLVERSAENPQQAIVYLDFNKKDKHVQSFFAPHIIFHPLLLQELAHASFQICSLNGEPVQTNLKSIFIQLEIKRSETHGWL